MSIVFTPEQRQQAQQWLTRDPAAAGVNFSDAYAQIAAWLENVPGGDSVRAWFIGATQANGGSGTVLRSDSCVHQPTGRIARLDRLSGANAAGFQ